MLPTTLLRKKLCGYRHMPDDMREELHLHIGQFLGAVTFETPDRLDLTEEMKILIAAQAGLLLVGGVGDYSKLRTVHVYRREFRMYDGYWDTIYNEDGLHVAWEKVEEGVERFTGWNPLLFRLPAALLATTGWRGHEAAFTRAQQSPALLNRRKDVQIVGPDHLLQLETQCFFETPGALKSEDPAMYALLSGFYNTDPLEWKSDRRAAIGNQPIPEHWNEWMGKLRHYAQLPPDQQSRLRRNVLVFLDEIDFAEDRRLEITEEMKVTIAAYASLLLLGPHHEALEGLSQITLERGYTRHIYNWQGDQMKFGWEKVQEDLVDQANARNGLLHGFFRFLFQALPDEHPALTAAFEAYEKRKRDRKLFGWEWDGCKITDEFAAGHFVTFLEQPHNVQHDLPELYAAFQEYFALDPIEWDRLAKAKRRVSFDPRWRTILSEKISLYKKLPKPEQEKLEHLIPEFLAQVDFIPQGIPEITEEMKVTIAAEACILVLGRDLNDYRNLRTVELWKGNPDGKRDAVGDANRERVRLNWEFTAETALTGDDNYNIVLHEFAHVIDNADDGDADSIPLPSTAQDRRLWEDLIHREQSAIRSSRYRDDKHLVREYGATNKAEFFTCATEAFFEKPVEMKRDHANIYELLQKFYQLDPATWPGH